MWNICIPVLLVTLLIAVTSYEAYILTHLSHIYTRRETAWLFLRSSGTELFVSVIKFIRWSWYNFSLELSYKMVLSWLYIGDNGEHSDLHFCCCSGLAGNRTLSQYNSFTLKIVLKKHSLVKLVKKLCTYSVFIPWKTELWDGMIILLWRWSWKTIHQ